MDSVDKIFIILICIYLLVLFITICVLLHQNDLKKEKQKNIRYKVIKIVHPKKATKKKKTSKKTTTKKKTNSKKKTTTKKSPTKKVQNK